MKHILIVATLLLLGCPPTATTPTVGRKDRNDVVPIVWERVSDRYNSFYRTRVPGGWLIVDSRWAVYLPDENHEWAPLILEDK